MSNSATASRGLACALGAYTLWGVVFPLYMKLLSHVSPLEIVAHRVIWAVPFGFLILMKLGRVRSILTYLRSPRTLGLAALTATLISINWGVYVYAIVGGKAVEAALGYYINPLVNVVLAAIFLGERPAKLQWAAIALAAVAVLILTVQAGGLPWISLVLALTFGTYGLLRKMLPIPPAEGFLLEVLILVLPCLALVAWTVGEGTSHFVAWGPETLLLIGAGPLTALPLILFATGAKLLDFSTLGILQYMVPTLLFGCAVFLFGEPFSHWQLLAFAFIWTAVAIYIWSMLHGRRARRRERAETALDAVESL